MRDLLSFKHQTALKLSEQTKSTNAKGSKAYEQIAVASSHRTCEAGAIGSAMSGYPLVAIRSFIRATRDSGYKSTSSAIAELVDNAFEADASRVEISVAEDDEGKRIVVTDNGSGMSPQVMQLALQFGGSTRFDSRRGTGRYGMGLPNGSLSQARRVDVYSWTNAKKIWSSYLDVDEIAAGELDSVPAPTPFRTDKTSDRPASESGTIVALTKCDRLDYRTVRAQAKRLQLDLGRLFRHHLYAGRVLEINGHPVKPIDPLFIQAGNNLTGAEAHGPALMYPVAAPDGGTSPVSVRFVVLPIEKWHALSNEEKNLNGISKGAGVSVIRAGREIDFGWYFMGTKRKENYDDWWRCEVSFSPELDELFGVTHTKQKINPTEILESILSPDLERVARDLNGLVRKRYLAVRGGSKEFKSTAVATDKEHLMKPVALKGKLSSNGHSLQRNLSRLGYQIDDRVLEEVSFYAPSLVRDNLTLILNRDHTFFQKVYKPLLDAKTADPALVLEHVQLLLLAAARAECSLRSKEEKIAIQRLRETWSNALTAFLG